MDFPDLPDCLRWTAEQRAAAWKGKRPRPITGIARFEKKDEPADVRAFRLEQEKKQKAKDAERFKMLRERAAEKKVLGR